MTWTYRPKRDDLIIPNIYLYWGIPHHAPSGTEWRASSGMRVFGNPRYGLPHKTSRAILIYLATMGTDRHKRFEGSLAEINEMFDADWSMASLEKHFLIVTHSEFECTETACACPRVCSGRQRVVYDVRYRPENHTFRVTISDELHRSAGRGIECPREHIQAFVRQNALASLDLYFWYMKRTKERDWSSVGFLTSEGPMGYIKSARDKSRKRGEMRRVHRVVAQMFPELPFHLAPKDRIEYDPDRPQELLELSDDEVHEDAVDAHEMASADQPMVVEADVSSSEERVDPVTVPEPTPMETPTVARPSVEQTAPPRPKPRPTPPRRMRSRPASRPMRTTPAFRPFQLSELPAGLTRPTLPARPTLPERPSALVRPRRPERLRPLERPQLPSSNARLQPGRSPPTGPPEQWDALLTRARALLGAHALEREG